MNQTYTTSILLLLLVSASVVDAADPPTFSSTPPSMGEAQMVGDILVVSRGIPKVIVTYAPPVEPGGVMVPSQWTKIKHSNEAVAAGDYRVFDMQGKPVDPSVLAVRLNEWTPVLFSDDGRKVDPQYLVLYKPGTLIVYLRPQRPQAPAPEPAPVPVPAPEA